VRSAAELLRVLADLDDTYLVAVLLAEEHHRPELARLVDRRHVRAHGNRLEHLLVDEPFDPVALLGRQRLLVREVEAQLVRPHSRAGLLHVVAEHVAERLVQQVRRRVVRLRREPVAPADHGLHPGALLERRVLTELDDEHLVVAELEDVRDLEPVVLAVDDEVPLVAHLSAARRVERALLELHELARPGERRGREDRAEQTRLRVADELGRRVAGELRGDLLRRALAASARDHAVLLHEVAEAVHVDRLAALLRELLRQLDREAVGGREIERILRLDGLPARQLVEDLHPTRERLAELLLLGAHDALDVSCVLTELRVRAAHLLDHDCR
jgi:hypothetical protein